MSTRLLMIRHGYSIANSQQKFAGDWDIDLTEMGREQAVLASKYFDTHTADVIYSSDLKRAYQTAEPIAEKLGLPIHKDRGLREITAGEWETVTFDELKVRYPEEFGVWCSDIGNSRCVGGESVAQLVERITETVKRIAEAHDGQTVCITTHATPIRAMCTVASGLTLNDMASIPWVSNASVSEFEYDNGTFSVIAINQTEHLGDCQSALPADV